LGLRVVNFGAEYGFLTLADDDKCLELPSFLLGLILKLLLNSAFSTAHDRIENPNETPINDRPRPRLRHCLTLHNVDGKAGKRSFLVTRLHVPSGLIHGADDLVQ